MAMFREKKYLIKYNERSGSPDPLYISKLDNDGIISTTTVANNIRFFDSYNDAALFMENKLNLRTPQSFIICDTIIFYADSLPPGLSTSCLNQVTIPPWLI